MVEADRPGLSIGKLEHKLGIKGSPTGSPVFEDVRVPHENVIGEVGRGLSVALGTLQRGVEVLPMEVNPATASLYIVNPLTGGGMSALFSTHPPIAARIERLVAFDANRGL